MSVRNPTEQEAYSAAVEASSNAPARRRRRPAKQESGHGMKRVPSDLHSFEQLPAYLQDNEFIVTGYRYTMPMKDTWRSLFNIHNETGNIYSHLLGFVLFVCLTVWVTMSPPTPLAFARPQLDQLWHSVRGSMQQLGGSMGENLQHLQESLPNLQSLQVNLHHLQDSLNSGVSSLQESVHHLHDSVQHGAQALAANLQEGAQLMSQQADHLMYAVSHQADHLLHTMSGVLNWPTTRWPVYVFCAGAMTCLLLSSVCHLFGCCQPHLALLIWRFDYAGIAILIVSSFFPPVYYGFLCSPAWAIFYLSCSSIMGLGTVAVSLLQVFQQPQWRATRAGMFVGLGLFGIVPILHQFVLNAHIWHVRTAVKLDLFMGALYIAGAAVYALRIPERWRPGKFDILLHSHQIFHVCVVAAAYVHWRAVLLLLEWRDASGGCAVPLEDGPVHSVLHNMRELGHELLHIDQVWDNLRAYASAHFMGLAAAGAGGEVGAPGPAATVTATA